MKITLKTALVFAALIVAIALFVLIAASCATRPIYITKSGAPEPPPGQDCTNDCPTNGPFPSVDPSAIWLETIQTVWQPGETPMFLFVTCAHNLTNGVTYYWERTDNLGLLEWIPLSSFTATGPTAYRTNGIANPITPGYHFVRLRWQQ